MHILLLEVQTSLGTIMGTTLGGHRVLFIPLSSTNNATNSATTRIVSTRVHTKRPEPKRVESMAVVSGIALEVKPTSVNRLDSLGFCCVYANFLFEWPDKYLLYPVVDRPLARSLS